MEVIQSVLSQLDGARLDAMSRQLGASPQQTERAIEAALPLLLGQLARNSAEPQGAQSLQHALAKDHAQVDLEGLLGAVLGGGGQAMGGQRDPVADGTGILEHVFGQRRQRVANSVGQFGGMSGQQSGRLLSMLAPIVMAVLSRAMQNRGGGTSGLGDVLGNERREIERNPATGGLLGKVLDRDGDGDVDVSDLLGNGRLLGGLLGGGRR